MNDLHLEPGTGKNYSAAMPTPAYQALDLIGTACTQCGGKEWQAEWRSRTRMKPQPLPGDQDMMRHFAVAIAFSQGARSSVVRHLVREAVFAEAFADFEPARLARKQPEVILRRYWDRLGHMRFRGKIERIVECAKVLLGVQHEFGSFGAYLKSFRIPRRLCTTEDIDSFWERFDRLRADLRLRKMPFFQSTTSLLQLLLDLDYDSVKPDLIVMRLARRIGMVDRELGERQIRKAARSIQEYAVAQGIRAQAVDIQILAFGGQTGARELLTRRFCPASDPCHHNDCPVGNNGLCKALTIS
ncbi:MAG: DNA-3-methyladenine glycosylase I [Verrucomicrobiales bacterium]